MAVERQTDRHATFVTLRDKQEEIRNRGNTSSVELLYSLVFKLRESMLLQLRLNNKPMTKITHELFLTFWREKKQQDVKHLLLLLWFSSQKLHSGVCF